MLTFLPVPGEMSQFPIDSSDLFNNDVVFAGELNTGELNIDNSRMIYAITRSFIIGGRVAYLLSVKFSNNDSIRKPSRAYN